MSWLLILLAPMIGGLFFGLERVVRARMQNRIGPPLLQPFYDMLKLIDKRAMIIHPYHTILGIMYFLSLWIVVAFIILGENLLYIVFLHLLSTLFIVVAGYSVKSIYSHIGANRELLAMVAYEPLFILVAVGFYMNNNGTFDISVIRESGHYLFSLGPLFIAFLLTMPIKLKKSPFDAAEAHQEIVGGVEIEYSGLFFEFIYMAKWLEYIFIYSLLFLFAGNSVLLGIVLSIVVFIVINLVDNATASIKIDNLLKIVLGIGFTLGFINLLGLYYV